MIDNLAHFLLIARHGTFTEAARRAHLTQPALSASVARLEADMGARLLHRGRHGAGLTAAGRALLPRAQAALAAVEEGRRAVAEVAGLHAGEVRLGAGATACAYLLPQVLAAFRRAHPHVRFLLREATTDEVLNLLHAGDLDVGVITHPGSEFWREDPLILVAAPDMEVPANVQDAPFVSFGRGATTRQLLEETFPGARVVMELGGVEAVKSNVRAGNGVALVSRTAVAAELADGRLKEIRHPRTPIARDYHVVHRGQDRLPPAAAAFCALLRQSASPVRRAGPVSRRKARV